MRDVIVLLTVREEHRISDIQDTFNGARHKPASKETISSTLVDLRKKGLVESSPGLSTGGRPWNYWELTDEGTETVEYFVENINGTADYTPWWRRVF